MTSRKWAHCIGSTSEDAAVVAVRLLRHLARGEATMWVEDDGKVYCAESEMIARLPTRWIAGTYQLGLLTQQIADDLRAIVDERAKSWIVE